MSILLCVCGVAHLGAGFGHLSIQVLRERLCNCAQAKNEGFHQSLIKPGDKSLKKTLQELKRKVDLCQFDTTALRGYKPDYEAHRQALIEYLEAIGKRLEDLVANGLNEKSGAHGAAAQAGEWTKLIQDANVMKSTVEGLREALIASAPSPSTKPVIRSDVGSLCGPPSSEGISSGSATPGMGGGGGFRPASAPAMAIVDRSPQGSVSNGRTNSSSQMHRGGIGQRANTASDVHQGGVSEAPHDTGSARDDSDKTTEKSFWGSFTEGFKRSAHTMGVAVIERSCAAGKWAYTVGGSSKGMIACKCVVAVCGVWGLYKLYQRWSRRRERIRKEAVARELEEVNPDDFEKLLPPS